MANEDKGQASDPKEEARKKGREPEHYPPVRADDAVEPEDPPPPERRSFDDTSVSTSDRRLGPGGDPAEGKP